MSGGAIEQVGSVVPGHAVVWWGDGQVADQDAFPSPTLYVLTSGSSYTMGNPGQVLIVNKPSGSATGVTLPAAASADAYTIKDGKGDAATNNITITPTSGTIDGASTKVINSAYGHVTVIFDGTNWNIIA